MSRNLLLTVILFSLTFFSVKKTSAQTHKPVSATATGLKASIAAGLVIYQQQCLACHQVDGGGVSHMNPPLIKTKWVLGDKQTLINTVIKGLNTPIEIDGDDYHNVMPPHPAMTDQQVADVLSYVRNSFGNKAPAVKATDVAAARLHSK